MVKPRKPSRSALKQSALVTVAGFLVASAVLRLIPLAEPAMALVGTEQDGGTPISALQDPDLQSLLDRLRAREADLAAREAALQDRERALRIAEDALEVQLDELIAVETALADTIAAAETAFETDVANLTDVFGEMKPKQAAALFSEMDPGFAAGFLSRMRAETSAGIMAAMEPHAAYSISVIMAGRNANVPLE